MHDDTANQRLLTRIREARQALLQGHCSPAEMASTLLVNGRALDAMPYALIRTFESLSMDFEIASWCDEEGTEPDLRAALQGLDRWLDDVAQLQR
ncbi:hypothetical protein [Stenotrophomonas rhizophila]